MEKADKWRNFFNNKIQIVLAIQIFVLGAIFVLPTVVFSEDIGSSSATSTASIVDNSVINSEIEQFNKQIEEKKAKIKQIEENIAKYKEEIRKKRLESLSISNQMSILDNRVLEVELDIESTEEKLQLLNLEIEELGIIIKLKNDSLERQKQIVAEMVRALYESQGKSYIEILASYDSFSDFYNQVQYLETVEENLGKSVAALRETKIELEEKTAQTEDRRKSYADLNEKLQEKKKDLNEQIFSKQNLLVQTHDSELTFKTMVSNLRQQYEDTESEIQSIENEVRKKMESRLVTDNATGNNSVFIWPAYSKYVTAYFRDPNYPYRYIFEHNAIDIRASQGTPIVAASSGYVAKARRCSTSSCYSYIMLVHSGGFSTVYGHLSQISVAEEQFVARGDVIGYSGGTPGTAGAGPFVTGPHLHFEIRKNGIPVDPLNYLGE